MYGNTRQLLKVGTLVCIVMVLVGCRGNQGIVLRFETIEKTDFDSVRIGSGEERYEEKEPKLVIVSIPEEAASLSYVHLETKEELMKTDFAS